MAKLEQIHRLMLVAEFLKGKPKGITYQETKNYLERKFEEKGFELKFSEKTFKRDRELISEILGIESNFKRSSGTFKINNEEDVNKATFRILCGVENEPYKTKALDNFMVKLSLGIPFNFKNKKS